jgi:hypothetical protein
MFAYLGHIDFDADAYIWPMVSLPHQIKNSPNQSKMAEKIQKWPAISAASAVEIVLQQLCGSQAEFAINAE